MPLVDEGLQNGQDFRFSKACRLSQFRHLEGLPDQLAIHLPLVLGDGQLPACQGKRHADRVLADLEFWLPLEDEACFPDSGNPVPNLSIRCSRKKTFPSIGFLSFETWPSKYS